MKKRKKPFENQDLLEFSGQMARLLQAGISPEESIELLREEKDGPILEKIAAGLAHTGSLTGAVAAIEGVPVYFREMIRVGEEAGRLDEVLERLETHYAREIAIRRNIRGAIAYPALMLTMLAVILGVLLVKVMPVFDQVFAQLGSRLTGFSRMLAELGGALRENTLAVTAVAAVLLVCFVILERKKGIARKLLRRLPWFSRIWEMISLCRLSGALSLVLSSGISSERALELAAGLSAEPEDSARMERARDLLEQSGDLVAALRESGILTGAPARQAVVGQRTGSLEKALERIADDAREEADRKLSAAIGMIEPALVIVLSLLVGAVLLSVLMPMLGILSVL